MLVAKMAEIEKPHEIADRRSVSRNIGINSCCRRIRQFVAAAARERTESPVCLDKLQDRTVVIAGVVDEPILRVGRYHHQGECA